MTTDALAMTQLVQVHGQRAYLAALCILRNEEEARDAAQESFILAFRNLHRYDRERPFYPWLHRIVRNHCIDRLRKRREVLDDTASITLPDWRFGPEEEVASTQTAVAVNKAMATLSDEYREILVLRHFQDLSYPEIAEALEIPEGTVMSRLYRARKALRSAMLKGGWTRNDSETME